MHSSVTRYSVDLCAHLGHLLPLIAPVGSWSISYLPCTRSKVPNPLFDLSAPMSLGCNTVSRHVWTFCDHTSLRHLQILKPEPMPYTRPRSRLVIIVHRQSVAHDLCPTLPGHEEVLVCE